MEWWEEGLLHWATIDLGLIDGGSVTNSGVHIQSGRQVGWLARDSCALPSPSCLQVRAARHVMMHLWQAEALVTCALVGTACV